VIGPRVPAILAQAKLMESRNRYDGIHPTIVKSVQTQARSLFRGNAVPTMDIEDIEQELMLHVHRRLPEFDHRLASLPTFVDRIVRNHAATLIEAAKAEKRGSQTATVWLSEPVVIDMEYEPSERSELIGDEHCLWRTPALPRDEQIMLRCELTRVLQSLPASIRDVFHWLAHSSISEAARGLGISRASLYDRLVPARTRCAATGLEIYLGRPTVFASFR
jgi:DNA-directed RNA polymerase specialized sigma24 family protein